MENYESARQERADRWNNLVKSYETKSGLLDDQSCQLYEAHAELERQKAKLAEKNGDPNVSNNDILDINAGGQIIRVTRGTMTHFKGSRLEALFSGRWEQQLQHDSKGRIFLDVNPICFKSILDFLNECKIAPPDNMPDPPFVDKEHEQFLDALVTAFGFDHFERVESAILTDANHFRALMRFLEESGIDGGLDLLYRGSRDGMTASSFHSKCDNQGSTVTLVKSQRGHIFGGFADQQWQSRGQYVSSNKAFLFGFHCYACSDPIKLGNTSGSYGQAMYDHPSYGPTFGGGHDLLVLGIAGSVSTNLGHTFSRPMGSASSFFTDNLAVEEIEVFKVESSLLRRKPPVPLPSFTNTSDVSGDWVKESFGGLPQDTKASLLKEKEALMEATNELAQLQEDFGKEDSFIERFAHGRGHSGVVSLNVSGHPMAVKASTLEQFPESVLYKHLADPLWNKAGTTGGIMSPRDWNSEQVVDWVSKIPGLPIDISQHFNDTSGAELLAMGREDIKELGVQKPGSIALLLKALQELGEEDSRSSAILIEHSEYCVGKIIDHMRLKAMSGIGVPAPDPPQIREPERKRFRRIVEFYFPNESEAAEFLG